MNPATPAPATRTLRLGTRGSVLARTQSQTVADLITEATGWDVELVIIRTHGDDFTGPLHQATTPGLFVSALRHALLDGRVDVVVHSMKDLPSEPESGIRMAACPTRIDPRDALISRDGATLADLPRGARIGTGSPRRAARLLHRRPDLIVLPMRGNVDSRITKVRDGDYDATVLAVAGVTRLGRESEITEHLSFDVMLPAPAQGALAVECRTEDSEVVAALGHIDDRHSRLTTTAERAVLTAVGATCATALGAHAVLDGTRLSLQAEVSGRDSAQHAHATSAIDLRDGDEVVQAYELGLAVGAMLLDQGADAYVVPDGSPARRTSSASQLVSGRPVLLVRADVDDDRDASALRERGLTVVQDPYITVVPATDDKAVERARETLAQISQGSAWLVVSSRAALRALTSLTSPEEVRAAVQDGLSRGLRAAAVGQITAEAMYELGLQEIVVPEQFSAVALVEALSEVDADRAILPRGNIAMRGLVEGLNDLGWSPVEQVLYETATVTTRPASADALEAGEFSAVVFRSPSAVRAVAHHVKAVPVDTALICGGRTTADEVARIGLGVAAVSRGSTAEQIADLVVDIVGDRSPA
jgi:hydroxymethylbilane synthase